jgi:hypothetical protein
VTTATGPAIAEQPQSSKRTHCGGRRSNSPKTRDTWTGAEIGFGGDFFKWEEGGAESANRGAKGAWTAEAEHITSHEGASAYADGQGTGTVEWMVVGLRNTSWTGLGTDWIGWKGKERKGKTGLT